jgi:hypothetical protein
MIEDMDLEYLQSVEVWFILGRGILYAKQFFFRTDYNLMKG